MTTPNNDGGQAALTINKEPNMKQVTLKMVRDDWNACYEADRLAELFDTPKTAIEVLTLTEGPWASVPPQDRLWVVLREELISARTLRLFACWCAEQAIALIKEPDPRSLAAIEVARRFANGEATQQERVAAWDAAWVAAWDAAAAEDAAWAAAGDPAGAAAGAAAWAAAGDPAGAAAWAAAGVAAWDAQIQTLIQMIEQDAARSTPAAEGVQDA